jgi:hypothetical protein
MPAPYAPPVFCGVDVLADVSRQVGSVELLDADGRPIAVVHGVATIRIGAHD